jgi:hypothetical protein
MAKNVRNQTGSSLSMSDRQMKKKKEDEIKTMATLTGIPFKKIRAGSALLSGKSQQSNAPVVKGHFDSLVEKFGGQSRTASA